MRLTWLTDVHLEFTDTPTFEAFVSCIRGHQPDGLVLAGDTATSPSLRHWLRALVRRVPVPIYFVLGNHDYYHGSIRETQAGIAKLCEEEPYLRWLGRAPGSVQIGESTAIVGHGCWGDAQHGNVETTPVRLNDFLLIEELAMVSYPELCRRLASLGRDAAAHLEQALCGLPEPCEEILVVTHVPPFVEAAVYEGRSDPDWMPFFTCKAAGDVLLRFAEANPHRRLRVLCGHTHSASSFRPRPNLVVQTGRAEYGTPEVQGTLELP